MATQETLETTKTNLNRIQQFDVTTLSREAELGQQLSFKDAVAPATQLINIYKRIPLTALEDFTDLQLNSINQQALADFNTFSSMIDFDATEGDAANRRSSIITGLQNRRDELFNTLWQFIAYCVARNTDTSILEIEARAAIQSIKDQSEQLTEQLNTAKTDAENALVTIRAVAAEQGVSQQAIYFKQEAESQENLADKWLSITYRFAWAVGSFAIISLFLHKIDFIKPESNTEIIQLMSSKFLIFAVLGYLLLMAARNYTTHKHNAIVNKHRQNALLTYQALVTASINEGTEDIVLAHAASCIFSPQDTGFSNSKGGDLPSGSKSVLELMTKRVTAAAATATTH